MGDVGGRGNILEEMGGEVGRRMGCGTVRR